MDIQAQLSIAQNWVEQHVFVLDNLVQMVVLVISFIIARLMAPSLRERHKQWIIARGKTLIPGTMRNAINVLIFYIIALVILWLCVAIAGSAGWQGFILYIVVNLLSAWIVIRFTATLVRNPFLTKTIAVTAWTIAALSILGWLQPVLEILDSLDLSLGKLNISVLTVIKGLVYLAVFLWIASLISKIVEDRLKHASSLTPSVVVLTGKLVRIILITIAFFMAISSVGIDLTAFTVFGGALGVGLGFGLQKVISNFVSGIILLLDKSIKPGDVISVGNTYGWVKSLNARYVSLNTRDGIEHLIPNEDLIVQRVENWSYSHNKIRLKIPVGVHYQSDVRKAIELCTRAAIDNPRILKDPEPACHLKGFGDSSVDLEIRMWIDDPQNGLSNIKSEVLLEIWDKFQENHIEIPYPQRDLHIKTPIKIEKA